MRQKWARLLGFLAVAIVVLGVVLFAMTLTSGSGEGADVYWAIALNGIPTSVFALLFGSVAFILSRPSITAGRAMGYSVLAAIGALCAPIGLWLLGMAYVDPITVILLIIGLGAYYILWRDIRKRSKTPAEG